jgi:hypothetical protein
LYKTLDKTFVMPYTVSKQPNARQDRRLPHKENPIYVPLISPSAHFAFRSRLDLGKALTLLGLVFLACLLTTRSAHAQSDGQSPDQWIVQNQNNDTVSTNANGPFYLLDAPAANGICTYPSDMTPADFYNTCPLCPYYFPNFFDGTPNPGLVSGIDVFGWVANYSIYDYQYWNGTTYEAYNGTTITNVSTPMTIIFKYAGTGTPPAYLDILVCGTVQAEAQSDVFGGKGILDPSELSATFSASDGLGESMSATANPWVPNSTSLPGSLFQLPAHPSGSYLMRLPVVDGKVTVSTLAEASANEINLVPYAPVGNGDWHGNGEASASGSASASATAQIDTRDVTISANVDTTSKKVPLLDANGNQTSDANGDPNYTTAPNTGDADGTMHGDTIYSYHDFVTTYDSGPVDTDKPNWITFTPNYVGNWHYKSGTTHNGDSIVVPDVVDPDTWSWSPNESEDTWDYGKCFMPWATNFTEEDEVPTGQDASTVYNVTYSATDNTDQASATANYVMTVHDPYEKNYPDHVQHVPTKIRTAPDAAYALATYPGETLNVGVTQGDSWTVSSTFNCPIALASWVSSAIGINVQVSHQVSYASTVTLPVTGTYSYQGQTLTVQPGDETYIEEFDQHARHYGKVDTWSTGGYTGTQPYDYSVPDNPAGGFQVHMPLIHTITGQ